jgi:hypothetical protein
VIARLTHDSTDIIYGHIKKVCSDSGIASGKHEPSTLDTFLDGVCMSGGVLLDSAVDDHGLGGISQRG